MFTLKEWRRAKGVTKQELADHCKIHVNTFTRWEEHPENIPLGQAYSIADYMGLKFEDINFLSSESTNRVEMLKGVG